MEVSTNGHAILELLTVPSGTALEGAGKDDSTSCIFMLIVVEGVSHGMLLSLSNSLSNVFVCVSPQSLLISPLEGQSLVLTCDPSVEYPFLEESFTLEQVVTPSVSDVHVVDIKLSRCDPPRTVSLLQVQVPAWCAIDKEEREVKRHSFWIEIRDILEATLTQLNDQVMGLFIGDNAQFLKVCLGIVDPCMALTGSSRSTDDNYASLQFFFR